MALEDSLKALKVTDLKAILQKAQVSPPSRKNDMIAKIIATPAAVDAYNAIYEPEPPAAQQPAAEPQPKPQPTPASEQVSPSETAPVIDEEEKRRRRAERFGIPVVPTALDVRVIVSYSSNFANYKQDPNKLVTRSARFGNAVKRPAAAATVDSEEEEKRKKRAERFGIKTTAAAS
ncbi:hypothetical protein H0H92_008887 [Tricholoma furcatifolium]|nr:hypothetical protein H0H92_008887 [Tricholoma furcatifolium]